MADKWITAFIQYTSNFVGYIFTIPIFSFATGTITLGETFLYFALAGLILRFIFNSGGSMKWFEKEK